MSRQILVGIDVGTTVLKVAAFDRVTGQIINGRSRRFRTTVSPIGAREQDAEGVWRAVRALLREIGRHLNPADRVEGMGLAAQGGSAVVVDHETGKPCTALYLWNDMRFWPYQSKVIEARDRNYWRRLARRDEPGWGLARMLWMKACDPSLLAGSRMYVGIGEFIFHRLTGVWQQDAGNAHQIGCYHAQAHRLSSKPLEISGVLVGQVAPLRRDDGITPLSRRAAQQLGLPDGLPVVGPYMDHEAGFMAAESLAANPLQCSLGTAWVGNFRMPKAARWSSPHQFLLPNPLDDDWLVVQPLLTGNVCWDWALSNLLSNRRTNALSRMAELFDRELLPPDGLLALPWFNMPNTLWQDCLGSGAFFGLSLTTNREHMLRAIAASMVCELRRIFTALVDHHIVDTLILSGGASKVKAFQLLIATMFHPLSILVVREEQWVGARGALRPFGGKVGFVTGKCISPNLPIASGAQSVVKRYVDLFDRLYGEVIAGKAVQIRRKVQT